MCGILGWVGGDSITQESRTRVDFALDRLRGRGPNGKRAEFGSDWVLGHTRLKVLDLTERAAQPMRDSEGRWLVFNGEIYNFKDIRSELEAHGHRFRSTGDTEVVLQALARWGIGALEKLHGMFALGWLDPARRELLLARDRFGVKPLVWERTDDGLRFASDLFALDAMAGGGRQIDAESARDYLMLGYVPAPRCIWRGPRKVMPGTYVCVRWRDGGEIEISESSYWTFRQVAPASASNGLSADAEFQDKFRAAIQSRLVSDVPVGLLLSGGIDSSSIAAACAELPGAEAKVPAYTMGFTDTESDERAYAREVAESIGIKHEEFVAEETDIASLFDATWTAFDEPFADSSALPMVLLCREIGKRVTVAIGGDGGDEVWCGYPWHRALYRVDELSWVPYVVRSFAARMASRASPKWRYQGNVFGAADRVEAWAALKTGLTPRSARFLPVDAQPALPRQCFEEAAGQIDNIRDPLDWAGRMDLMTYLPDDLMVKADRASMKVGLELREPLLHYGLVEWGLTLPIEKRFDYVAREGKQPARHYLASRVPAAILTRPKKGFTPPLRDWLNGALEERRRQAIDELTAGELNPLVLPSPCDDWNQCSKLLSDNHHQFLWRVVCFAGWKRARKDAFKTIPGAGGNGTAGLSADRRSPVAQPAE